MPVATAATAPSKKDREAMAMSTLTLRILSSAILAPIVIAAIWYGSWPFWIMLLVAFAVGVYEWLSVSQKTDVALSASLFGILYLAFSITCFGVLRDHGIWIVVLLISAVWMSDIGGYGAGRLIGGPKMAPKISPNKTWAGLGGAIVGSILVFVIANFFSIFNGGLVLCLVYGGLIAVSGQAGDLLVSKLKRRAGVKDMSHLIPGHGGLLDRIDSLLLAGPVFFFTLKVIGALL
jgi:phosphatidate cytidylyltransferase